MAIRAVTSRGASRDARVAFGHRTRLAMDGQSLPDLIDAASTMDGRLRALTEAAPVTVAIGVQLNRTIIVIRSEAIMPAAPFHFHLQLLMPLGAAMMMMMVMVEMGVGAGVQFVPLTRTEAPPHPPQPQSLMWLRTRRWLKASSSSTTRESIY